MLVKRPVFIVGAPRTGKKMTSEVLDLHKDVYAFKYEINFLWRYGNKYYPYDTLKPDMLTPKIYNYINGFFGNSIKKAGVSRIVDRTDHNIVRLDYIKKIFPDCLILHIIRDGRAAVASAIKRRQSKVGMHFFIEKTVAVPIMDLPYYGLIYLTDILQARLRKEGYRKLWGIRTVETEKLDQNASLAVKCAVQWQNSVKAGLAFKKDFSDQQFMTIRYEEMILNPLETFIKIYTFCGLDWSEETERWICNNIKTNSLIKWKKNLSNDDLESIRPYISDLMKALDYRL